MASTRTASKFFTRLFPSLIRNSLRPARTLNNHNRICQSNLSHSLSSSPKARSISTIRKKQQAAASNLAVEKDSAEKQNDAENSLVLGNEQERETLVEKVKKSMAEDLPFRRVFAIVHIGGKQFKITSNDIIMIHKMSAKCGDKIKLRKILMVGGREFSLIGKPLLSDNHVNIEATVLEKTKGRNVIVFKKKRRKNYKKWKEHRQDITVLRINKIDINPEIVQ